MIDQGPLEGDPNPLARPAKALSTKRAPFMPTMDAASLAFRVGEAQARAAATGIWQNVGRGQLDCIRRLSVKTTRQLSGIPGMLLNLTLSAFRNIVGLLPLRIGIDRGSRLLVPILDPLFGRFQDHEIRVGQLNVSVRPESPEERALAYFWHNIIYKFKQTPLFKLMKILRSGDDDIFVDIGAHFGMYSLLARDIGYKSIMFEPEKTCFRFLERNPDLGEAYPIALSDRDGEADFFVNRSLGGSSLVSPGRDKVASYVRKYRVIVRRGATIMKEVVDDVRKIRLIKIDVEGEEENVLDGLHDILESTSAVIWCEVRGPASDRNPNSCLRVKEKLERLGYATYCYDGKKMRVFDGKRKVPQVFDLVFSKSELPA